MDNTLRIINANLYTPQGCVAVHGRQMGQLLNIENAVIEITDGTITHVGNKPTAADMPEYDAKGRCVLPGFVDSHTHLIFGGYRPDEFGWRMRGDSYMSIMNRGGGIVSTTSATMYAPIDELTTKARMYIEKMSRMGVTTVEAKSGYGLDHDTEIKMLRAIKALKEDKSLPVNIAATFMGAHAMPKGYEGTNDEYITFLIDEMLPEVKREGLAEHCDVFCEEGVFTVEQSRRLLQAAQRIGFTAKLHADEIVNTGGAQLGAEIGALSADHLLHISNEGISALAASDTVATLLPLTAFALKEEYAPGRRMIDAGCAVALATDFNPGSCFSCSVPLMIALACIYMGLSVEEAITALTINGAAALGMADTIGSVDPGKRGDLAILAYDSPAFLPYFTGMNCVTETIHDGEIIARR